MKSERFLEWMAIGLTVFGLCITCYYQHHTLKAIRVESELNSYLNLSERYHRILHDLLQNDPLVFQRTDNNSLEKNKYVLYEAFELFSTVHSLGKYHKETLNDVLPLWNKRFEHLFKKPAARVAWESQRSYAHRIYNEDFINDVEHIMKDFSEDASLALQVQ